MLQQHSTILCSCSHYQISIDFIVPLFIIFFHATTKHVQFTPTLFHIFAAHLLVLHSRQHYPNETTTWYVSSNNIMVHASTVMLLMIAPVFG